MATSGQVKTNTTYESYFWVSWEQIGKQDIANNRTQIKWSCGVSCGHSFYTNAIKMSGVSINGALVYGGGTYSNFSRGEHTIASGTLYIQHNNNGTKSFDISAFTGWLYSQYNYSASATSHSLDTIPRQATISSAPDFTDEENPTITYSNPAGNAVSSIEVCISLDNSKDDIAYRTITTSGTSYQFTLTDAERDVLRNATTTSNARNVYFCVRTVIGGATYYSTMQKRLTIVNANPTFTADELSYADVNEAVVAITGNNQHIVQNQSSLTATIGAATANKGAKITEYTLKLNDVTKTATASGSVSFGAVNSSQDVTLSVTAKDSRGNTTTIDKNITVLAWSLPVFTASLERLNNYEDETHLKVDASISSVNGKNTIAVSYKYKQSGGSYGDATPISNKTEYTIECDKNHAYVFSITVADHFGSTTAEYGIEKGKFPLFIDTEKAAVGINEFPNEGEALRVAGGNVVLEGGLSICGVAVGDFVVEQGTSGIWTYRKWNNGIAECWGSKTIEDAIYSYQYGSMYYCSCGKFQYPFQFIEPPIAMLSHKSTGGRAASLSVDISGDQTSETGTIYAYSPMNATATTNVCVYAFGRWK